RLIESVVRAPAVVGQVARIVPSDDLLQGVGTATGIDRIAGRLGTDPAVQPGGLPALTPTGLIHRQAVGVVGRLHNLLVRRLAAVRGTQHGVHRSAARQADAEQRVQAADDFAVR